MRRMLGLSLMLVAVVAYADDRPLLTTFYPTYGYLNEAGDEWTIPFRVWVHSPHAKTQRVLSALASISAEERERKLFGERIADIVADSRSWQDVRFVFDQDPRREVFRLEGGLFGWSGPNGVIEDTIKLSRARAEQILQAQGSTGWLTLREISPGKDGSGRVLLLPPEGQSVVSDIDDTVKITEVPAGKEIVFRNTFLREFVAAPNMATWYQSLAAQGSVFHFVSGGPWQLYGTLSTFLSKAGYPEATFHLKEAPKNLLDITTWQRLHELAQGNTKDTYEHKKSAISELLERFPHRKFTLIGDSGECDPEVFSYIRDKFRGQVEAIHVRHVLPGPPGERLAGMTVIPADPVPNGVSPLCR